MISARSTGYFARCTRFAVVAGTLGAAVLALRGERAAHACSGGEPFIGEFTTFDPGVIGDAQLASVQYDPYVSRFGGYQPDYGADALVADWHGYLNGAVDDADWRKILFEASAADVAALQRRLAGKSTAVPTGYEDSSLWSQPAARAKLGAALAVVHLVRQVEPSAIAFEPWDHDKAARRPAPAGGLLATARAGMTASAADPFLAQRYAFQATRILFYQDDAAALITFFDQHAAVLAGPSPGLGWRARYYLAGALANSGNDARAELELARIHANYSPLAGPAMSDFHPQSDTVWHDSLALARTTRERTELWRMVGVKFDGMAAAREIRKLDPKSDLIALLVLRELARAESLPGRSFNTPPDPQDVTAAGRALAAVEQLALQLASTPGADRPWLMHLVAGHIAARRGDLATARARLERALAGKPGDARVASQVKASLSLALIANWKIDDAHEREFGQAMNGLDRTYERADSVRTAVRDHLAKLYKWANRLVDAEYLHPGTVDPTDDPSGFSPHPGKLHWADISFLKDMLARRTRVATEFDRFLVTQPAFTEPRLQQELALRYALDGDFAAAKQIFTATSATSTRLEVDPFVTHIKDCRECDEEKFARAAWTHASLIARLAQLGPVANSTGEAAAEASLQIGNALYNITWYGNARRVLRDTHQDGHDARAAERWYHRAYDLTKNRERKAQAAYLAAKAERGNRTDVPRKDDDGLSDLPLPTTWFTRLKPLSDTRYYKEVLRECGTFRTWVAPAR
jgi:hypothetical protein